MDDGPTASRRSPPLTNPFSQPAGSASPASQPRSLVPIAASIASWSSSSSGSSSFSPAASSSIPLFSSRPASFVSDTPQFSRKKARHVPIEQQRAAVAALARNRGVDLSASQYSRQPAAAGSSSVSASSSQWLVGVRKRKQLGGATSERSTDGDDGSMGKFESEKAAVLAATLSPGQQSVVDAVQSGKSVFFTGCAGTGKSFLLTYLKHSLSSDTTFFTASTGLAAVNISGQTLHSFAGVGLGEGDASDLLRRVMVAQHARRRWQTCQILVIDEVSMIDRVLFDKLEYIARSIRKNPLPFGGIQLILTGDFLQLPPVKGRGFAFESRSWSECVPVVIELQSVFRQKNDSSLVGILNQFRRGVVDRAAAAAMQACINRSFDTSDGIEATELYAMKAQVSSENDERLAKLDTAEVEYAALDKGNATYLEQLTRSCNAVERLLLKEGAQVMLIKNLTSALVNGSRGVVVSFDVQDANEMQSEHRRVSPSGRWPRVKFTNGSEMTLLPERWDVEVSQKSVASRTQVPLMLAWSLTVHKCQGMTLDRVRLHLGSIFEYGQAYVALSRIRSLDSLSIKDKFPQHVIKAHPKALQFYDELHAQNGHSNNALPVSVPPPVHAAPTFASNTPADIPDPYGEQVGDGDMDISDELIAMAANDADETDSSSASQLLSSTFAERDSLLSPASFSSSAASPFVRASMLSAVSVSQPAAAPSRADGISQHLTVTTSLTSTASSALSTSSLSVSAETRAQPSITAATVRRHQLLLKKQTKATPTQTTLPPAASAPGSAVACTAVGEMASSPPAISGGTRTDEIDLVSDDEDSASPPPVSAVNQWSRRTAPTAEPNQQPVPITSPIAAIVSPHAPLPAPSSDSSVPSPSGRIPVAATLLACTARLAADDGRATKPLPPIVSSQCGAHNRPLQAHIDWNKENEPDVQTMKMDGEEGKKREQTGGVQWLYRCEMGCLLAVRLTT